MFGTYLYNGQRHNSCTYVQEVHFKPASQFHKTALGIRGRERKMGKNTQVEFPCIYIALLHKCNSMAEQS